VHNEKDGFDFLRNGFDLLMTRVKNGGNERNKR